MANILLSEAEKTFVLHGVEVCRTSVYGTLNKKLNQTI